MLKKIITIFIVLIVYCYAQKLANVKGDFSIFINSSGKVFCWGANTDGQLGNGTTTNSKIPIGIVPTGQIGNKIIKEAAGGEKHSLCLSTDGYIFSWGNNEDGQLGNGSNINSNLPQNVITNGVLSYKKIIQVAAGKLHSLAIDSAGSVFSWGYNGFGQLGNGNNLSSNLPVYVFSNGALKNEKIIYIDGGNAHSIALSESGKIFTWGWNAFGQLGNGTNLNSSVPVMVDTNGVLKGKKVIKVVSGAYHNLALTSDGLLISWGRNFNGQLGNGDNHDKNTPVFVDLNGSLKNKKIVEISASGNFSAVLTSDGKVYTWGSNNYGQLGINNFIDNYAPIAVDTNGYLAAKMVTQIATGYYHSLAIDSDGVIYSWGDNTYGQLGNNTFTMSNVPVKVFTETIGNEITTNISKKIPILYQNYPNPFNPTTTIKFFIPRNGNVELKIYDCNGKMIKSMINNFKSSGEHYINFEANNLPNGVYLYKLRFENNEISKKMILLK